MLAQIKFYKSAAQQNATSKFKPLKVQNERRPVNFMSSEAQRNFRKKHFDSVEAQRNFAMRNKIFVPHQSASKVLQ